MVLVESRTTVRKVLAWLEARFLTSGVKVAVTVRTPISNAGGRSTLALPPCTGADTVVPSRLKATVPPGLMLLPVWATSAVREGEAP